MYPPLEELIEEAVLQDMGTYVSCQQNTVVQLIVTWTIMDLCLASARRLVPSLYKQWWDQDGLDLDGTKTAAREAEQTEGGRGGGRDIDRDGLNRWGG